MSVFFLVEVTTILDKDKYHEYIRQAGPIIAKYGGEYILQSDQVKPISGNRFLRKL